MGHIEGARVKKLGQLAKGLHSLFPLDEAYSYSILIPVKELSSALLETTIKSALNQTAPQLEILLGIKKDLSTKAELALKKFIQTPCCRPVALSEDGEPAMLNALAKEAKGNYLLPLMTGSWIRPDYLYRCEQFLRLAEPGMAPCLYTDEMIINSPGYPLPGRYCQKPSSLHFPFHFKDDVGHSLLIPREKWLKAGGIVLDLESQGLWEFALRLDLEGCTFHSLPFPLYAHRLLAPKPIRESAASDSSN